jgi:hypothetical protein
MERVKRKRNISLSAATIGSASAILTAVYGPALSSAIGVIGAGGGLWSFITAAAENRTASLREDKWYYVWCLARDSNG